jgi:hypothetical protein
MSALHTNREGSGSKAKWRQAIYDFPSSGTPPIIDMGGTPVSFTVEYLTDYRYVIVQIDTVAYAHWAEIQAFDENGNLIEVINSSMSSLHGSSAAINHHDGNLNNYSHTTNAAATLNGVSRGAWAMIDLGKPYAISKIILTGRVGWAGHDRETPHRVFLTDTFIDAQVGVNTLEMTTSQKVSISQSGNQATYTYYVRGTRGSENSWEILQDTDNQVVASKNYIGLSTYHAIPTETFQVAPEHLGYTGAYTLTMYDSVRDGWDKYWNMKVTSTDIHGRTTVRAVTQGPRNYPTSVNRRVLRIHLSGDTTPVVAHDSSGPGVTQLGLTPQKVYQNKMEHLEYVMKTNSGPHIKSKQHIVNIYNGLVQQMNNRTQESFYWEGKSGGTQIQNPPSVISNSIGNEYISTKLSTHPTILHDVMTNLYDTHFNNDVDLSMYEVQPLKDTAPTGSFNFTVGSMPTSNIKILQLPAPNMTVDPTPVGTNYADRFSADVSGTQLSVRRTDQYAGWGQNLILKVTYPSNADKVPAHASFTDNQIIFTTRLGYTMRDKVEKLSYYLENTHMHRNGISISQYASEVAVEMLQNSALTSFSGDSAVSELPMSCGYSVITDTKDATNVLNVRIYVSHVVDHPFIHGRKVAISSGVNLFDLVDIRRFRKGLSSSNFITQLTETIQTLNDDPYANFNETAYTTWEYGTPAEYDSLTCIKSPTATYWDGELIKDCQLRGSTEDVPKRIFFILDYINTQYTELYNNQFIIINDINGIGKVVSIVKITITLTDDNTEKITFQCRDSHIDNLFPIANVNADMTVNGELQVANYLGDVLLHVDPVTDKTMLMGKMGINQEMHDINAMLDIDNLSNKNLLDFTNRFMPLILDSIMKMDTFITYNPYDGDPTTKIDQTAAILDLKVYSSMAPVIEPNRLVRFATLQARVELPVRIYTVVAGYRVLHSIDDKITKLLNYKDRLMAAKYKQEEAEEEAKIWGAIIEATFTIATSFLPGVKGLLLSIAMNAANFDVSDFVEGTVSGSSEEIQDKIDQTNGLINTMSSGRIVQQGVVNGLMIDMQTQAGLLGLSVLYDRLLLWQVRFTIAVRMYTSRLMYVTATINEWIQSRCSSISLTINTPSWNSFTSGKAADADQIRYEGEKWQPGLNFSTFHNLNDAIDDHTAQFIVRNTPEFNRCGDSVLDAVTAGLASRIKAMISIGSDSMETETRTVNHFYLDTVYTVEVPGYIDTFLKHNQAGSATITVLNHMRDELSSLTSDEKLVVPFLSKYITTAEQEVYKVKKEIRNNEKSDIAKSTKVQLTQEDTTQQEFAAFQEDLDAKRLELEIAEARYNALDWVIRSFPYGAHSSAGDHRKISQGYMAGWKASTPYGWILRDSKVYNQRDHKLNEVASHLRPNASREKGYSIAAIEKIKDYIKKVDVEQNGLMDNLQEYTSSHDWDSATHNQVKHLISDIYKMYLVHGTSMKSSELSYTCILPVTTKSDNMTSAMYIKMVLSLEDDAQPQVSLSGRLLDVTEFTRDLSYKETLSQLMQGFSAGSQLVNYGVILLVDSIDAITDIDTPTLITDIIRDEATFNNRFGNASLYLIVDNLSDSTVVQHERYAHWNNKKFFDIFHPGTNTRVSTSYKTMNDTFINHYGFDPLTTALDNPLLSNMYMVPHKYDDVWRMAIVRYVVIEGVRYRVSCVIDVGDYLDQSIITKGDSTFHGDFTVKSSDNREIFQIDTLNNTSANLYPLSIGAQHPRTMLDVQDASIMDINYFITKISKGMRELTAVYQPTLVLLSNTDDYKYKYRFNMYTKKAEDTVVIFHELYPKWDNLKYSDIMEVDKDRATIIKNSILPALQRVIDTTLFYPGSIYSTRIEFTSGMKYSVHKIVKVVSPITVASKYDFPESTSSLLIRSIDTGVGFEIVNLSETGGTELNVYTVKLIRHAVYEVTSASPHNYYNGTTFEFLSISDGVYTELKMTTLTGFIATTTATSDSVNLVSSLGWTTPPTNDAVDMVVNDHYVEAIGQGWDIQTYGINIITNPNVEKLMDNLDANIEYINFIRHRTNNNTDGGPMDTPFNIQAITDKYRSIEDDVYKYTLQNVASVLDQKVSFAHVSDTYDIGISSPPISISKITEQEQRVYHTSFIVDYTKDYDGVSNRLLEGDFGILPCRDTNYYYYAMFYKLRERTVDVPTTITGTDGTQVTTSVPTREASVAVFFVNMTKDHILPSMSIEGDLAVAGELTLSGLTTRQNAASIYLTVDPENHFVGINSNDRFANYSLKHTSEALGSIYDTSQHLYVKNDRYPNATFARIAEITEPSTSERDYDATKDYTLFGTYSAATMLRCSDIWTYAQAQERADHYTTSLANINTTDWQKKKRYGTDIAFEIKDVSGVTTELGEVQMVIDSIDMAGNLHAGFGVQVVDRTLGTIFPQALKNIMYVNNDSELFVNGVMLGTRLLRVNPNNPDELLWGDIKVTP